jgi:hypothetical protein
MVIVRLKGGLELFEQSVEAAIAAETAITARSRETS